jgi:hypothetical protein
MRALNAKFIAVRHGTRSLTIPHHVLLKRNYNLMNQPFLAALVKIRAPKFTKLTPVVDLLWRMHGRFVWWS